MKPSYYRKFQQYFGALMLSMMFMDQIQADDQAIIASSMEDPEAFFMFLANSIEDNGELITPLDIEELDIKKLDISEAEEHETNQEEIAQ